MAEINDNLSKMIGMEEEFELLANIHDRFNGHFLKKGWISHESINFECMKSAVELADNGCFDEAEDCLIDCYSKNLEINIQMIKWMEEMSPRRELLQKAYEDYLAERYHSCIPLIFSIIDGVVADTKEIEGNKVFFAQGEEIYAWDSIAAHKTGLTELRRLLYQNRGKTTTEELEIPFRNGILHGRDLGYANKKVATKLWATLFALKDGIITIKQKGKEPKEDSYKLDWENTLNLIKDNEKRDKLLKTWIPRDLIINDIFPETGNSSDYEDGTPEQALVEFFEYWKANNFGKIAQKIDHLHFKETSLNDLAGKLSREVFNNKKLCSFKIINILDEGAAVSEITAEINVQKGEESLKREITFRLIYENDDGDIEIRSMNNGSWKFVRCFSEIDQI